MYNFLIYFAMGKKIKSSEDLLKQELDGIDDPSKQERIEYFVRNIIKEKAAKHTPFYILFLVLAFAFIWCVYFQHEIIQKQQHEIETLMLLIFCNNSDATEDDNISGESESPFEFQQKFPQTDTSSKLL